MDVMKRKQKTRTIKSLLFIYFFGAVLVVEFVTLRKVQHWQFVVLGKLYDKLHGIPSGVRLMKASMLQQPDMSRVGV